MMHAGGREGGQRQNMTLLAERTQRHIVFPSETLALILYGLHGAAGGWGGLPAHGSSGVQGPWKVLGPWGEGLMLDTCPTAVTAEVRAGQGMLVPWMGTTRVLILGPSREISCARVPRNPQERVPHGQGWLCAGGGCGRWPWSTGSLQSSASVSIHFGLVPFSFLLRFPFPGKQ